MIYGWQKKKKKKNKENKKQRKQKMLAIIRQGNADINHSELLLCRHRKAERKAEGWQGWGANTPLSYTAGWNVKVCSHFEKYFCFS